MFRNSSLLIRNSSLLILLFNISFLHGFGDWTFFTTRSQSVNAVRELVGWQQEINKYGQEGNYGAAALTIEYNRSWKPDKIAHLLFGCSALIFSGSNVANRGANDVLADYFGLPLSFESRVCFSPRISNVIFDLNWYQGLDCFAPHCYVRVHLPMVETKWDLHFHEYIINQGRSKKTGVSNTSTFTTYPGGYMSAASLSSHNTYLSVQDAFEGKRKVGDREPLAYGKIFGRQTKSRVADLQVAVGYNFLQDDWYHAGVELRVSAPTGTRPTAEFLFEAIVGNCHHWEVGMGLTSHVDIWQCATQAHTVALYGDLNITHLCKDTQRRSFDIAGSGKGSRYMLLEEVASPSNNLLIGPLGPPSSYQYIGRLLPAINVTTLEASLSIACQVDMVVKCTYRDLCGLEFDLGYNLWARSKEKLHGRCGIPENQYVIKGDAQVYGFDALNNAVPLAVSQHSATVLKAQGTTNFVTGAAFTNNNADSPVIAFNGAGVSLNQLSASDATTLGIVQAPINTSATPIFLTNNDINESSALLPHAISHKIFIHGTQAWHTERGLQPYVGGGIDVEFAPTSLHNSAHPQWAIWFKGGISY